MLDEALEKATDALDDLSGGKETSQAQANAEFVKDVQITPKDQNGGGSAAPDPTGSGKPVTFDFGIPTEFIHFGKVHADIGKKFPHASFDPQDSEDPPEGHAILFRDALAREAIMLFAFVSSTKVTVIETGASKGALEDVVDIGSDLLGGGSSAPAPNPAQLDTFLSDIQSAAGKINKDSIKYPDIHAAGKKLHETRATYIEFCNSLNDYYIKPPDGALDQVGGLIANVPGVGNIMALVQRFAFKMQDLYLAAYLELRKAHEASVEDAAHGITIDAIKGKYADHELIYPIWSKKREGPAPKPATDPIGKVEEEIDDIKDKIAKELDPIYDFLGMNGAPEPTPGSSALAGIFSDMRGSPQTTPGATPSASACITDGLDAAMVDITDSGVPGFIKTVIAEVNDVNLALLEEIYARLMAGGIEVEINSAVLYEASRRGLSQKLVDIMAELASGIMPGGADDFSMGIPGGDKKFSAKAFIAKLIEEHLSKYAEPIIAIAIGELAGQMEASRLKAEEENAQTMEVLIGRIPWFTALMFRNIFFPMWNIVVEKVFDEVAPEIANIVKEINTKLDKAKDTVDTVSDYSERADNVQDQAADNLLEADKVYKDATSKGQKARARDRERNRQKNKKNSLDKFYTDNDKDDEFPITSRVIKGDGEKVTDDIESVLSAPA